MIQHKPPIFTHWTFKRRRVVYDDAGSCVLSLTDAACRGHCHLTLCHTAVLVLSSCIDLHAYLNSLSISNIVWNISKAGFFSGMTEWSWHINNCSICGTVISNMLIWHFAGGEKTKKQISGKPLKLSTNVTAEKLSLHWLQIYSAMFFYSM